MSRDGNGYTIGGCLITLLVSIATIGGWLQHLYTCFTQHYWGFLIAGAIFFPIGIIHGCGASGLDGGTKMPDYPHSHVLRPRKNKLIRSWNDKHIVIVVLTVGTIFAVLAFL